MRLTNIEIVMALSQHRAEDVLGTPEMTTLDFKRTLYPLDTPRGKLHFCLDVAAMANADGGMIVCGFHAKRKPTDLEECASESTPVPRDRLDLTQHHAVLMQYLWPRVQVSFNFLGVTAEQEDHGYLVIEIAALPPAERYAMVRKFLTEDGKPTEGFVVPIRHGDQTTYLSAEDLYRLANDGLRFHELATTGALGRAESTIGHTDSDAAGGEAHFDARLAPVLDRMTNWEQEGLPVLVWQSAPLMPDGPLEGMYERKDGVYGALDRQQVLRDYGFNFSVLNPPRIDAGALESAEPRHVVRVDPDGTVTAVALATQDMLGWNMRPHGSHQRLNVLALTEITLEYFRLVDEHVVPRVPGGWRHRILAIRFKDPTLVALAASVENPRALFLGSGQPASAQDWTESFDGHGDAERDAYEALTRIYGLFGQPITANPFVQDKRVSAEKLLEFLAEAQ